MTYSHVAALILRSIILKEDDPYIKLFSPTRIKPVAGFVSFLSHNADVVKQFAGKWLSHEKLDKLTELKNGEGKVMKYKGENMALFRDDNSTLHVIHSVCTHMKCEIAFNEAEQTWDCPCHGARYLIDGNVVTGPANQDLERIEIKKL